MSKLWWFVMVVGSLAAAVLVGSLCVSDPAPEATDAAVRQFMVGAGPFLVVAGAAMIAVLMLDDLDDD